jgi:RNA polymerase sigma factor (sigma-70 family)
VSPKVSIRLLAAQSDRRLLDLVAGGHERAFEVLVRRYRGELLRYCRRMGLSESRSEDALQHALLQAWLALERGVEVHELRAWLYRIVHNTAINLMRRSPEDHSPLTDATAVEFAPGVESDVERTIAVRDALSDVAALPPMQRDAILLTAVDGRSHEEVASALGVTHGAVRGLLYRARTTLRGAAAALTPQPLIGWLYGGVAKVAPTAQRLTELSTQGDGGAGASGTIFKGAALAVTAAVVVAGAAVVPLHPRAAHRSRASAHPAHRALAAADARAPATSLNAGAHGAHVAFPQAIAPQTAKGGGTRIYASNGASLLSRRTPHSHARTRSERRTPTRDGDEPATAAPSSGSGDAQSAPAATVASSAGAGGGTPSGPGGEDGKRVSGGEGAERRSGQGGGSRHMESEPYDPSDDPSGTGSEDPKSEAEHEHAVSVSATDSLRSSTAEPGI